MLGNLLLVLMSAIALLAVMTTLVVVVSHQLDEMRDVADMRRLRAAQERERQTTED